MISSDVSVVSRNFTISSFTSFIFIDCHWRIEWQISATKIDIYLPDHRKVSRRFKRIQVSDLVKLINSSAQCIGKRKCEDIYCYSALWLENKWKWHSRDVRVLALVFPRRERIFPTGRREIFAEDGRHGQSARTATIKKNVIANPEMLVVSCDRVYTHTRISGRRKSM